VYGCESSEILTIQENNGKMEKIKRNPIPNNRIIIMTLWLLSGVMEELAIIPPAYNTNAIPIN
jgi:hypothetical protein